MLTESEIVAELIRVKAEVRAKKKKIKPAELPDYTRGKNGAIRPTIANGKIAALSRQTEVNGPFYTFDRWQQSVLCNGKPMNSLEVNDFRIWCSSIDLNLSAFDAAGAIESAAFESQFDSMSAWLIECWGKSDDNAGIERVATEYLGVTERPDVANRYMRRWMQAAVLRALIPGMKVDSIIVLEGTQGARKSTALRTLAFRDKWFFDGPLKFSEKDSHIALKGRWIVEFQELEGMNNASSEKIKAFLSTQEDTYRAPYERLAVTVPRRWVGSASTNASTYMQDSTGSRRFYPIKVGKINIDALANDVEELWGRTVNECFNLAENVKQAAGRAAFYDSWSDDGSAGEVLDRQEEHPWLDDIQNLLESNVIWKLLPPPPVSTFSRGGIGQISTSDEPIRRVRAAGWPDKSVTIAEVMAGIRLPPSARSAVASRDVVAILARLGWKALPSRQGVARRYVLANRSS